MIQVDTDKIKDARSVRGLTQKELADAVGVSIGTLINWETGRHEPSDHVSARRLVAILGPSIIKRDTTTEAATEVPAPHYFYVAGGMPEARTATRVMEMIRRHGGVVIYDWTGHGAVNSLGKDELARVANHELWAAASADCFVILGSHARKGSHVEMGAALVSGVRVVLWLQDDDGMRDTPSFYAMPQVEVVYGKDPVAVLQPHLFGMAQTVSEALV